MDNMRVYRNMTKVLSFPITVGSVLHNLSPYTRGNSRLTLEGERSLTGESSSLTIPAAQKPISDPSALLDFLSRFLPFPKPFDLPSSPNDLPNLFPASTTLSESSSSAPATSPPSPTRIGSSSRVCTRKPSSRSTSSDPTLLCPRIGRRTWSTTRRRTRCMRARWRGRGRRLKRRQGPTGRPRRRTPSSTRVRRPRDRRAVALARRRPRHQIQSLPLPLPLLHQHPRALLRPLLRTPLL
jgi:hypothetical protein